VEHAQLIISYTPLDDGMMTVFRGSDSPVVQRKMENSTRVFPCRRHRENIG